MALQASERQEPVVMLGDIVHNEHVVKKIDDAGVRVVEDLEHVENSTLLLRAHGTLPETHTDAQAKTLHVIDATCPLVLEIHEIVKKLDEEGYRIVVIGDYGHDEVNGIAGQVGDAIIIAKPEDVKKKNTEEVPTIRRSGSIDAKHRQCPTGHC